MNNFPELRISQKLKHMLEEMNQAFGHAKETVLDAYNQARSEGFSPEESKKLILQNVRSVKPRTIYLHLPDECKNKHMQIIASKRLSLQSCSDTEQASLESKTSSSKTDCQNEAKKEQADSATFMDELRATLENRKPTKELYQVSNMIHEREKEIEEKDKLILELQGQKTLTSNYGGDWLILSEKYALHIFKLVSGNNANEKVSKFSLQHDGLRITEVHDLSYSIS